MKKNVVYAVRVHSVDGKRIIVRENKTHVWRIGKYTPRKV